MFQLSMFDTMIVPLFVPQTPAFLVRKPEQGLSALSLVIKSVLIRLVSLGCVDEQSWLSAGPNKLLLPWRCVFVGCAVCDRQASPLSTAYRRAAHAIEFRHCHIRRGLVVGLDAPARCALPLSKHRAVSHSAWCSRIPTPRHRSLLHSRLVPL